MISRAAVKDCLFKASHHRSSSITASEAAQKWTRRDRNDRPAISSISMDHL